MHLHVGCNRLQLKRFKFIISTFFFHFYIACTKRRYLKSGEKRFKTECEKVARRLKNIAGCVHMATLRNGNTLNATCDRGRLKRSNFACGNSLVEAMNNRWHFRR